jgi:glycosyltransferase involved in cell wall biosynthesis
MKPRILIFVPCYNVAETIGDVFSKIRFKSIYYLANVTFLFIDDCSIDKTFSKIKEIKCKFYSNNTKKKIIIISNKKNLGYGGVQKLAYNFSIKKKYDFAIMLHGDGQYHPNYLNNFIKKLIKFSKFKLKNKRRNFNNFLGVFGSRMIYWKKAIKGNMPIYKFLGNIFLTFFQNYFLSTSMSEFHSGYRSYYIENLKKINFNKLSKNFAFDTEIIIEAVKKRMQIKEFPINTFYGDEVSHLKSIPYGLSVFYYCFKYFLYKKLKLV